MSMVWAVSGLDSSNGLLREARNLDGAGSASATPEMLLGLAFADAQAATKSKVSAVESTLAAMFSLYYLQYRRVECNLT